MIYLIQSFQVLWIHVHILWSNCQFQILLWYDEHWWYLKSCHALSPGSSLVFCVDNDDNVDNVQRLNQYHIKLYHELIFPLGFQIHKNPKNSFVFLCHSENCQMSVHFVCKCETSTFGIQYFLGGKILIKRLNKVLYFIYFILGKRKYIIDVKGCFSNHV